MLALYVPEAGDNFYPVVVASPDLGEKALTVFSLKPSNAQLHGFVV